MQIHPLRIANLKSIRKKVSEKQMSRAARKESHSILL
jgi:hypothetical protein